MATQAEDSELYLSAVAACFNPPYDCSDGGAATPECFYSALAAGSPSAAQAQVKADFCQQCPDGKSSVLTAACSKFFNTSSGSVTPLGLSVLLFNDAIAMEIDSNCASEAALQDGGASGDCATSFLLCSAQVAQAHTGPKLPACVDGGGAFAPVPPPR
jgi:hypothetical protein